ncbi:MAG: AMP-binding protein [Clostridia bacterium]|nr:AMP-binding protein [Clostridia bacterium]
MKNYPLYETTIFENFRVLTENAADKSPDVAACVYRKRPDDAEPVTVTYEQMRCDIRHMGTEELAMGLRDAHVALIGESSYFWVCSYFSLMAISAVTVPLDKDMPLVDLAATLIRAETSALFCSPAVQDKVEQLLPLVPSIKTVVYMTDDPMEGKTTVSDLVAAGKEKYEAGDNSFYENEIDPDALASIVFTSGTTGKGKGVMLSQKNICSDMTQGMYNFAITQKTMMVLPPHHTYGSTVNFVGHFAQGATVYMSAGIKYILKELNDFKPTHLILVPLFVETFYKRIWATAEKQGKADLLRKMMKVSNGMRKIGIDLRRKLFKSVLSAFGGELQMIICGGASLNQDIINTFESIGVTVLNGYGITECAPLVSCNRNKLQKKNSVGTPIIGEQIKIANPDENGEGEICVKGPNVMMGYYKDPEATAEAFDEEGYFKTGDYGYVDDEGWIYITGRMKNLIIFSNGKNVYPEEIEMEISRVRGVNEVVVYAGESKKHPEKEVIVAEIYPDKDLLTADGVTDLKKYFNDQMKIVNSRMAPYKAVGMVKIRNEEFIKNTSRKITRFNIDKNID